jgi:hypothetical protein
MRVQVKLFLLENKMAFLYVCLFSNDAIKVGRSVSPDGRIKSHVSRVSCLGVTLVKSMSFECAGDVLQSERSLINWCADHASCRNNIEWFYGLDFDLVCEKAKEESCFEHIKKSGADISERKIYRNNSGRSFVFELLNQRDKEINFSFAIQKASLLNHVFTGNLISASALTPAENLGGMSAFMVHCLPLTIGISDEEFFSLLMEAMNASEDLACAMAFIEEKMLIAVELVERQKDEELQDLWSKFVIRQWAKHQITL